MFHVKHPGRAVAVVPAARDPPPSREALEGGRDPLLGIRRGMGAPMRLPRMRGGEC